MPAVADGRSADRRSGVPHRRHRIVRPHGGPDVPQHGAAQGVMDAEYGAAHDRVGGGLAMINRVGLIFIAISLIHTASFAQTTRPATGDKSSDIRQWFKQLADRDPEVRETARTKLMSIPRDRL